MKWGVPLGRSSRLFVLFVGCVAHTGTTAAAQHVAAESTSPTLTLHAETRLVIEDVLVTDSKGHPVHGLPISAFHITDNRKPQVIRSLEETRILSESEIANEPTLPAGTFSNASYLGSAKAISEVFLIDADDLEPLTQLYLLSELKKAVTEMPNGMQGGLFCVRGGKPVQVRGMTKNRGDLVHALSECLPSIEHTGTDSFASAVNQLLTVASFLQSIPGRKNVLWFAGPFPLVPITTQEEQPGGISVNVRDRERLIHQLQETLAETRVAVYPIDPRGVLTNGLAQPGTPTNQERNRSMGAGSGVNGTESVPLPEGASDMDRIDYMQSLAQSTGGKAYILNNLKEEVIQAFDLSTSAYTLSYAPHDYANDESWHEVSIQADGPYTLSYRRGYLAIWNGDVNSVTGRFLKSNGEPSTGVPAIVPSKPLLFDVKTEDTFTTGSGKQEGQLSIAFSVSPEQLGFVLENGRWMDEFIVSSYAYDDRGSLKGGQQQEVDAAFTPQQWEQAQMRHISAHQAFSVPKSAKYVLFVVRDKRSRRQGTLMLTTRALVSAK